MLRHGRIFGPIGSTAICKMSSNCKIKLLRALWARWHRRYGRRKLSAPAASQRRTWRLMIISCALPHLLANTVTEAPEAIRLLSEALRLDPDYAQAHAHIAMAYAAIFR